MGYMSIPNKKSAFLLFVMSNPINSMIKNFSFFLSSKTWFEPIVFPGSLAAIQFKNSRSEYLNNKTFL